MKIICLTRLTKWISMSINNADLIKEKKHVCLCLSNEHF